MPKPHPAPCVLLALAAFSIALPAAGARPDLPEPRSVVISGDSLSTFAAGGTKADDVELDLVKIDDGPATEAIRLGAQESDHWWDMGVLAPAAEPVKKGDVMLATFDMRSVKSMTGQSLVVFTYQAGPPKYEKSEMVRVSAGTEWTRINLPFVMEGDFDAGKSMAGFHLALTDQTLEIADFQVLNYGQGYDMDLLPHTESSYDGRAADAPWRAKAAERIEEIRKAGVTVNVVGARGQPVQGATVDLDMTRHAFPFGTCIAVTTLIDDNADAERYREELRSNFNNGLFESALKWNNYGTGTPEEIDEAIEILEEMNIRLRGGVIMWPSWRWISEEVQALREDPPAMRAALADRVTRLVTRYKDQIHEWDVVNEAFSNNDVQKIFGDEIFIEWFKLAREANPDARLFINDNDMLTAADRDTNHMAVFEGQIQMLQEAGAPLDGIGFQGHFSTVLQSPKNLWKLIDRFAEFGLPIQVTEFDVTHDDRQLQADYTRDFLTAVFAHESIEGFTTWGFWETRHWRPAAAMFDEEWNLLPHGQAYRDLVYGAWWTDESGITGSDGTFTTRGFLGEHAVKVTGPDGKTTEATLDLSKGGGAVTVKLD